MILCLNLCVFAAGGSAVLQSDQHAAADAGLLQAAPGQR